MPNSQVESSQKQEFRRQRQLRRLRELNGYIEAASLYRYQSSFVDSDLLQQAY
jgi:hypothetical protein